MKQTKIVATVGPSSSTPERLGALIDAGANVFRLNFSHGTHAEHATRIADIRRVARERNVTVAILQDLPGPKVRTGDFAAGIESITLEIGEELTLTTLQQPSTRHCISVQYTGLARDVSSGKILYIADGSIALRILDTDETTISTRVEVGGELRSRQGINYPDGTLAIDAVTDRDLEHLAFGLEHGVDWIAISFVKSARDIERVREFARARGEEIAIIAKIEKHEALDAIQEILAAADGIMVARGDLGVEIPLEEVPMWQKTLIMLANRASKPVITATQMLESMIANPRPTRAEAADVANAILDGTDAVMLSGETARGLYPVEAVRTMATIAHEIELRYPHHELATRRITDAHRSIGVAIAESAANMADHLALDVILTGTTTGNTARHIASFRPRARIIALTAYDHVARRLALIWGVEAFVVRPYRYIETLIEIAEDLVRDLKLATTGDTVVITTGMPVGAGQTNIAKLHRLTARA